MRLDEATGGEGEVSRCAFWGLEVVEGHAGEAFVSKTGALSRGQGYVEVANLGVRGTGRAVRGGALFGEVDGIALGGSLGVADHPARQRHLYRLHERARLPHQRVGIGGGRFRRRVLVEVERDPLLEGVVAGLPRELAEREDIGEEVRFEGAGHDSEGGRGRGEGEAGEIGGRLRDPAPGYRRLVAGGSGSRGRDVDFDVEWRQVAGRFGRVGIFGVEFDSRGRAEPIGDVVRGQLAGDRASPDTDAALFGPGPDHVGRSHAGGKLVDDHQAGGEIFVADIPHLHRELAFTSGREVGVGPGRFHRPNGTDGRLRRRSRDDREAGSRNGEDSCP